MVERVPITVVETHRFLNDARSLMTDSELTKLVAFIAVHPEAGDVIPGTGGVRKLRWALAGKGKRGGARVVYNFEQLPVFLLAAYSKNQKANLSQADRNQMSKLIRILVEGYPGKVGRKS
jgi:hypothetical protein